MSEIAGGPAFPVPSLTDPNGRVMYGTLGMSLRDYFAGEAMAICPLTIPADKARWCYKMADSMLEARKE